jgi:hypothetical protein
MRLADLVLTSEITLSELKDNPATNALPAGMTLEQLASAIHYSGYPLQSVVAAQLMPDFVVTEEWGFVDRETGIYRTLDIFAYKNLVGNARAGSRVEPGLILLIECKRSELPYVFFKSPAQRRVNDFPAIYGLTAGSIELHESQAYTWHEPSECLGLAEHSFITPGPVLCSAFSKSLRKGKDFELSGTDPFNKIMLPLVNAIDHAFKLYKLGQVQQVCYPRLVLSVCVLDAPMVVANAMSDELELFPWVRVIRQEPKTDKQMEQVHGVRHYAVDVVHKDYLSVFVNEQVLPFAECFVERACLKDEILATCKGVVKSLENWTWEDVAPKSGA